MTWLMLFRGSFLCTWTTCSQRLHMAIGVSDTQVKLLKHLQHENVVGLRDIMRPAEPEIATFPVHACS